MNVNHAEPLAGDMLENVAEIARFLGKTERQVTWLLEKREIPGFKMSGRWHARRSTLMSFIARLEADMMADAR